MTEHKKGRRILRKSFKGDRGAIALAREFRGGSTNEDYVEIRLANIAERLLNERDAMTYEYFVMHSRVSETEPHRGPWTEQEVDDWIREAEEDGFILGVFQKARRSVGRLESC